MNHNDVIAFPVLLSSHQTSSHEPTFTDAEDVFDDEEAARERDWRVSRMADTLTERDLDKALRRFRSRKPFFGERGQSELIAIIQHLGDLADALRMGGDGYRETAECIHAERCSAENLLVSCFAEYDLPFSSSFGGSAAGL